MGDIQLAGQVNLLEGIIFQRLKLKKGRKIDFARLQDALERIRKLYQKNHYLGYSLVAKREESNGKMDMILQIDSGPQIFLEYEGASIPKKIKREIVDTWVGSPFGQLALGDIEERIRGHFMEKRFYEVKVRSEERKGEQGQRTLVFQIQKGTGYGKPDIRIKGNRAVSERVIAAHLEKSGVMNSVFDKPTEWVKGIEDLCLRHGYLRPKVQNPVVHLERNEKKAFVEVSIDEGVRYKVDEIELKGLRFFDEDQILSEIGIRSGEIFGLDEFADSALIINARTMTKPLKQWRIKREFNKRLKKKFDEKDIEIPFPHRTLYIGQDKEGKAAPLRISMDGKDSS